MRANLKTARQYLNLTQAELATKLDISDRYYQHLEAGTRKGNILIWIQISKLFNKPIEYLLNNE